MCGRRLKTFSASLVLSSLLLFSPLSFSCYADVVLTDKEAEEILTEIQESQTELTKLRTQLEDVKSTYSEQKKSYEMQLTEAEIKNNNLKSAVVILGILTLIFIFI